MPDRLVMRDVPRDAGAAKALRARIDQGEITADEETLRLLDAVIDGSYQEPEDSLDWLFRPHPPEIGPALRSLTMADFEAALGQLLSEHCSGPVRVSLQGMRVEMDRTRGRETGASFSLQFTAASQDPGDDAPGF